VVVPEVAYCLAATSGRHTGTDWSRSYVSYVDRVRRLTPAECEGLQGFPVGWTVPDKLAKRVAEDVDTLRYHALGNAVCVPVVEWIGRRISAGLSKSTSRSPVNGRVSAKAQEELLKGLLPVEAAAARTIALKGAQTAFVDTDTTYKWGAGGCAVGAMAVTAAVPSGPTIPVISKFIDVIEKGGVDDSYFLSPNAAEGILRRVRSQRRTLFGPLAEALERLAQRKRSSPGELELAIEDELVRVANA
jgi:DNA (cytosine-5)-methyltransferase 1